VAQLVTRDLTLADPTPAYLTDSAELKKKLDATLDFLNTARPTAVNLGTAVRRLKNKLNTSIGEAKEPRIIAHEVVLEARAIHDEDLQRNKDMAKWAADWILNHHDIQSGVNVLTVCNTGNLATSVCHFLTPPSPD
jgi:methylthioribose-1-phosphate isomerase